jgi:hypothetical protein
MSIPDAITGAFECGGAFAILLSILRLYRDKVVHGFHWGHLSFFTAWGFWNLYYYPHLNQPIAFAGGIAVLSANLTYLGMILHYGRR